MSLIQNNQASDFSNEEFFSHMGEVIKVIGVGGGGCNAVSNMAEVGVKHVELICANTDAKALNRCHAHHIINLGHSLTRGLGAGSNPEIGKRSAMEDREKIASLLKKTDMLFIATGMGGGTGTGAAPVIAEIARELGILTVGVVTKPFEYEGAKRKASAAKGIDEMRRYVDSLIVIPNEKLMTELDEDISMSEAFMAADSVLRNAIMGITEVIKTPGVISVDFADVRTVMSGRGLAMMGTGAATGQSRAKEAAELAIISPLLDDVSLDGATGVLVNISAAPNALKLKEYHEIIAIIQEYIDPNADFKAGVAEIEDMPEDELRVTVIATGVSDNNATVEKPVGGLFARESQAKIATADVHHEANDAVASVETPAVSHSAENNTFGGFDRNPFQTPSFFRKKS